ncbi:MAG: response regulator transcription factor [Gammaproteobacteria bacterium]|nr:response regulator transcription factor [Gammaproteobacteria bacterium]
MKILVVDDHPLVRDALRDHLQELERGAEVFEARSTADALSIADQHPDMELVLLDLNLPDANGFSALTTLRERHPAIPVVVLSAHDQRQTVLDALDKGAMGFVPKTATTQVMLSALRLVLSGGIYLPTEVLNSASTSTEPLMSINTFARERTKTASDLGLTQRQAQILALLVQGKPNKIISRELGLAESTVKIHITAILRALNVTNRVQAVIAVGRLGLQLDTIGAAKSINTH